MPRTKRSEISAETAEVLEHAIDKAPTRDVGFFLKVVAIAILIVAIGYAVSLMFEGNRSVAYTGKSGRTITVGKQD